MADPEQRLFTVEMPLGFGARTTASYWELIQRKHPEVSSHLPEIVACPASPAPVRQSKQDAAVYLFYRPLAPYHLCVVVKRLDGEGFVITSYVTDAIKEGTRIWPTSE